MVKLCSKCCKVYHKEDNAICFDCFSKLSDQDKYDVWANNLIECPCGITYKRVSQKGHVKLRQHFNHIKGLPLFISKEIKGNPNAVHQIVKNIHNPEFS